MDATGNKGRGLFASLRKLGDTLVGIITTRIELFALEVQEEKLWVLTTLLWTAAAVVCGVLALLLITITVVYVVPAGCRTWALIGFCVFYSGLTAFAAFRIREQVRSKAAPFDDTIAELKKDLGTLREPEP